MRQFRTPDGTPMTLGVPSRMEIGEAAGVRFVTPGESSMSKAPKDGIYTRNGLRFYIAEGDEMPADAVLVEEEEQVATVATVTVKVTELEEFEALKDQLEAVTAERDALLAERDAAAVLTEPEDEERAKGKAAQNRANGPAPENRGV